MIVYSYHMMIMRVIASEEQYHVKKKMGMRKNGKSMDAFNRFADLRIALGSQYFIKSVMCLNEMIDKSNMSITNQYYDANLSFNVNQSKFYQLIVDIIVVIYQAKIQGSFT